MSITITQVKQITTGARITGIGTVASPLNVPDGGIDLPALANGTAGKVIGYNGNGEPALLDMAGFSVFSLGNDAYVIASAFGVTFAKSNGELTFTIPPDVDIVGGWVWLAASETDGSQNAYLRLNYNGTRIFNQDIARARKPIIDVSSGSVSPSRNSPAFKSNTVQQGITAVGNNNIEVLLQNIGTIYPELLISFQV
jgi:hypothetical protein